MFKYLFPYRCVLCGMRAAHMDLCHACSLCLPRIVWPCAQCGLPLPEKITSVCGNCLSHPPPYQRLFALFSYENHVMSWINALKFRNQLLYASLLGQILRDTLPQWYPHQPLPEALLPMPLHPTRLRERGFNQTVEIARPLLKKYRIVLDTHSCERQLITQTQSTLSLKARQHNVRHAFRLTEGKPYSPWKHVAILEDVVTSGQTIHAFATLLRKSGVEQIDVWTCARTTKKNKF